MLETSPIFIFANRRNTLKKIDPPHKNIAKINSPTYRNMSKIYDPPHFLHDPLPINNEHSLNAREKFVVPCVDYACFVCISVIEVTTPYIVESR